MSSLTQIPGLTRDAIDLLAGSGIHSSQALAALEGEEAWRKLELAAWQQGRANRLPDQETVERWIGEARRLEEAVADAAAAAAEIPEGSLVEEDDIPEAIIVERPSRSIPAAANLYMPPAQRAQRSTAKGAVGAPLPAFSREFAPGTSVGAGAREVDPAKFGTFEDYQSGKVRAEPLQRLPSDAPEELLKLHQKDRIPEGKQLSRWHRRGVVHPRPLFIVFGALVSLLWRLAVIAAVTGLPWMLYAEKNPEHYRMVVLASFGGLLVLGITQLIVMARARCRICSCQLFHSRNCFKNRKAHLLHGLGYTASLALHLLIFQWFRCMYCGTAIRLRPGSHDRPHVHRKG